MDEVPKADKYGAVEHIAEEFSPMMIFHPHDPHPHQVGKSSQLCNWFPGFEIPLGGGEASYEWGPDFHRAAVDK